LIARTAKQQIRSGQVQFQQTAVSTLETFIPLLALSSHNELVRI
jgi:hypothetical protein